MDDCDSISVPESLFHHVEKSLKNGLETNMLIEIAHSVKPLIFWIGKITMVCGPLLRVCYIGINEEIWCDITKDIVHPLGWCANTGAKLHPPVRYELISSNIGKLIRETIDQYPIAPEEALLNKGCFEVDRIKIGMKIEIENERDPFKLWIATVIKNVGGRLLLRYIGCEDPSNDFWLFYVDYRIHEIGYTYSKGHPYEMVYPYKDKHSADLLEDINSILEDRDNVIPQAVISDRPKLSAHNFEVGMKVEAVNPANMIDICTATVVRVFNQYLFLVTVDKIKGYDEKKNSWVATNSHPYIFPSGWAKSNNIELLKPLFWNEQSLKLTNSGNFQVRPSASKMGFQPDMKLEAVDGKDLSKISIGSIKKIVGHLLLINLEHNDNMYWYSHDSLNIFPTGWCQSHSFDFCEPSTKVELPKRIEQIPPQIEDLTCICIYFNYKCYSGPFISKNKLSQLPKYVGPGPLRLVIKEVLNKIISVAYKPGRLLKDWEYEGKLTPDVKVEMLKAKLKTNTHLANVKVIDTYEEVPEFCKEMCEKLQACPYLFGPTEVVDQCPEKCSVVNKAKFRKKKKKRMHFMTIRARERRAAMETPDKDADNSGNESEPSPLSTPHHSESGTRPNSPDSNSDVRIKKQTRKRVTRSNIPPLEMKTRGAKLPNFALQIKEGHWDKKDVQTIYNNTCVQPRKQYSDDSESDNNSVSCNSLDAKNQCDLGKISDVSDSEEPELKKLRVTPLNESMPTENKTFSYSDSSTSNQSLNLSNSPLPSDPSRWSMNELNYYLIKYDNLEQVAKKIYDEEIDGAAFLMLNIHSINKFLNIKGELAMRLCKCVCNLKCLYFSHRLND